MARIRQITTRDEVSQDKRHIVDAIMGSRGRVSGPFSVLLNSLEIAGRAAHLGAYIRFDSTLSPSQRELAIITAAREFDCEYEWAYHERLARQAGVRDEAIQAVAYRKDPDSLNQEEDMIVSYARDLLRDHRVSDATFKAAHAAFGDQGVTELTATIGYYGMLACALNAFQVQPTPDMAKLP
jgi:4-carboxymuconolactone decarboxylase